jgi:hypothetical protein
LLDVSTTGYPYFCSCPAFIHYVLQQKNHVMVYLSFFSFCSLYSRQCQCKHILATRLANRLSVSVQRQMGPDDLVSLYTRYYPAKDEDEDTGNRELGVV